MLTLNGTERGTNRAATLLAYPNDVVITTCVTNSNRPSSHTVTPAFAQTAAKQPHSHIGTPAFAPTTAKQSQSNRYYNSPASVHSHQSPN